MKKYISLILCAALICTLFTGCGASSDTVSATMAYSGGAMKQEAAMEEPAAMAMDNGAMLREESGTGTTQLPESRKWIITIHMSAETDDLDTMTAALEENISKLNGYVEDQSVYNGSSYGGRRYRHANLTVRIPADDVDQFTEEVAGISNVVDKQKSLEDVTLQYVATESKVKALQTEEARLLELLAQAENMTDLLEIEARLSDVRYELENHASQLKLYDNQIDYATIYLNISEVQEYTPVDPTLWERIRDGFKGSISGLGESLQDLLVFFVEAVPFLVVYGGIAILVFIPVGKLRKSWKERKAQRKAAKEAKKKEL